MKLKKFAYLYSKPLGNHTLKIMKKIPGNLLKIWKNHGNIMEFCWSEKVGTLRSEPFSIVTELVVRFGKGTFIFGAISFKYIHRESYLVVTLSSNKDQRKKIASFVFSQCKWTFRKENIFCKIGRRLLSLRLDKIFFMYRFIYTERTRKWIFFFDLCRCTTWTLNWTLWTHLEANLFHAFMPI